MGMYDSIACKYSGMSEEDREREYQTKDLNQGLDKYIIKEDGSLWIEEFELEDTNKVADCGDSGRLVAYKKTNEIEVMLNLTDTIYMYDYDDGFEVGYKIQWTRGKLTYIERVGP